MLSHFSARAISLLKEWYFRTREANAKSCYPPISTTWERRGLAWQQIGVGFDQSRCTAPRRDSAWEEAGHQFLKIVPDVQPMLIAYVCYDWTLGEIADESGKGVMRCRGMIYAGLMEYETLCRDAGVLSMRDMMRSQYIVGLKAIADHLGVSTKTIRRWVASSGFPLRRIPGGGVIARRDEIGRWYRGEVGLDGDKGNADLGVVEGIKEQ